MAIVTGKISRVDLTHGVISQESAEKYEERFIGARGINSFIVFNEVKPETNALDPENVVAVGAGPLGGTAFRQTGRVAISSKNVRTGGINFTNAGGLFGSELRHAGWGNIVITGKSEEPVYLYIKDDHVELRDASHLWGKDVWETEDALRQELGDPEVQTLTIGPAGENLIPMAMTVVTRTHAPSSGGVGAIFGSKNLKAIAVRGSGETRIADPARFKAIADKVYDKLESSEFTKGARELGCFGLYIHAYNDLCAYPYRNTYDDVYPDVDNSPIAYPKWGIAKEKWNSDWNNFMHYGDIVFEATEGPYKGTKVVQPQNNTFFTYGTGLDLRSPSSIIKIFELISRYGLDQDGPGVAMMWAYECFERGILTKEDTGGLDLTWGNDEAAIQLVHQIAKGEGFGKLLGQGCMSASQVIGKGSDYYCRAIKGQENLDTLRSLKAYSFGCCTSLRGGRHLDGSPTTEFFPQTPPEVPEKLLGIPTACEPITYEGKGKLTAWFARFKAALDTTGACYFTSYWGSLDHCGPAEYAEALSAATGREIFMNIGWRIHNVEKAFNTIHAGFTRKDDYPPPVYMREPIKSGIYKGELMTMEGFNKMLDEYYEGLGWDRKTSWQTEKNVLKAGLPEVAKRLREAGRLL